MQQLSEKERALLALGYSAHEYKSAAEMGVLTEELDRLVLEGHAECVRMGDAAHYLLTPGGVFLQKELRNAVEEEVAPYGVGVGGNYSDDDSGDAD